MEKKRTRGSGQGFADRFFWLSELCRIPSRRSRDADGKQIVRIL
jgi:hypothetical protein